MICFVYYVNWKIKYIELLIKNFEIYEVLCLVMIVLIRIMIFVCNSFFCNDRFVIEWKNFSKIFVKNINSICNFCFIECMYFKNDI